MSVKCAICQFTSASEIVSHLKEVHEETVPSYLSKYKSPVFSEDFQAWLEGVQLSDDLEIPVVFLPDDIPHVIKELGGVKFAVPLRPTGDVPPLDVDYQPDQEALRLLCTTLRYNERICLVGPTGCGKSTLIEYAASHLNWPMIRVAASGGLTESDLLGEWVVRSDAEGNAITVFNYGFLPRAMQEGAICLIDEIDGIEPSVAFSIHQVCEDRGRLVLLSNAAEVITPHENFRLCFTANTLGLGDDTGLYTGTNTLNAAFLDRMSAVVEMSYPSPAVEAHIAFKKAGCSQLMPVKQEAIKKLIEQLVQAAGLVRDSVRSHELYTTFSTRRLIELVRKIIQLDNFEQAFRHSVYNRMSEKDRITVAEIFQRSTGVDLLSAMRRR